MLNDQSILDVRKLITGKDGQLFVYTKSGRQIFLAECDEYEIKINVKNTDYQPVGSNLEYAVNTGFSATLTFTEAVVRDEMIDELLSDIAQGYMPYWDFQGKLRRRDGQYSRLTLRNCLPDGDIDLMNIKPGEIIKRQWSFRINATPEKLASFAY